MDRKSIIQIFVNFVEGSISFNEFRDFYESNESSKDLLKDKKPNKDFPYQKDKTIVQCLHFYSWSTVSDLMFINI